VRKIQAFVQRNTCDKNFGLDFNCKDAIDFETNFIGKRTFRTLNDYEMQHNAEVGLFTKPSLLILEVFNGQTDRF
jgi:hypothetical protein